MAEQKPFYLVVQLVKSQIHMEKLLRRVSVAEASPNLELLKEKYPWIKNPAPAQPAAAEPQPREFRPKYRVVQQHPVNQSLVGSRAPQAKRGAARKAVRAESEAPAETVEEKPAASKFDPTAQAPVEGDDRVPCRYCGRKFAADRIAKHEESCAKNPAKKKRTVMKVVHEYTDQTQKAPVTRKVLKE